MVGQIRIAANADVDQMLEIYRFYVDKTPITFDLEVPTANDFRLRLRDFGAIAPWLVYEENGEILGYAYGSPHHLRAAYRWSVNTSVYVRETHKGRGIGRELYRELFTRLEKQGFYRAYAGITLPNDASVRIHESFGFRRVGLYQGVGFKLGKWHDVGWWEKKIRLGTESPQPLRSPEDL